MIKFEVKTVNCIFVFTLALLTRLSSFTIRIRNVRQRSHGKHGLGLPGQEACDAELHDSARDARRTGSGAREGGEGGEEEGVGSEEEGDVWAG